MKLSLVKKLNLFTIGLLIIITTAASFILYNIIRKDIENLEKRNLKFIAQEISNDVYSQFWHIRSETFIISDHVEIIDFLLLENKEFQDEKILSDFKHHNLNQEYAAVYLMDVDGKVWISTDESFVGQDYSFREYFKNAKKNGFAHDISIGVTSGQLGYYFASSVKDKQGNVLGVLVIKLKPEILKRSLDFSNDITIGINLMLVDKFGVVVYTLDDKKLYRSLGSLDQEITQKIVDQKRFPGVEIEHLDYSEVLNFINSDLKNDIFELYDDFDGEREILAASKVNFFDYTVLVEESEDNFSYIARTSARNFSLIIILIGVIMAFVIYYFVHKLLSPLDLLNNAIKNLEKGDLSYRIKIQTGDELEDIATGFNEMAEKLEKNIKNIETKILERTKTLEELNKHMVGRELKMLELKRKIKTEEKTKKNEN